MRVLAIASVLVIGSLVRSGAQAAPKEPSGPFEHKAPNGKDAPSINVSFPRGEPHHDEFLYRPKDDVDVRIDVPRFTPSSLSTKSVSATVRRLYRCYVDTLDAVGGSHTPHYDNIALPDKSVRFHLTKSDYLGQYTVTNKPGPGASCPTYTTQGGQQISGDPGIVNTTLTITATSFKGAIAKKTLIFERYPR